MLFEFITNFVYKPLVSSMAYNIFYEDSHQSFRIIIISFGLWKSMFTNPKAYNYNNQKKARMLLLL